MIGALTGDMIGSYYERSSTKRYDFHLFNDGSRITDDSVMTAAVAAAILEHDPPGTEEYDTWSEVVADHRMLIRASGNMRVFA